MQANSEENMEGPLPIPVLLKEMETRRKSLPFLIKKAQSQNFKCFYCDYTWHLYFQSKGNKIIVANEKCELFSRATLDHVIPQCHGGDNKDYNIVIACYRCNNLKGSTYLKDQSEFAAYRAYEAIDCLYGIHHAKCDFFKDPWYAESFEGVCVLSRVKRNLKRLEEYSELSNRNIELPSELRYLVELAG